MEDNLGNEYCDLCKQLLPRVKGILSIFGRKAYKFADGIYCEYCAQLKIKRARGKQ